ncbi:MAG: hypothetical protein P8163_03960 [Candidatus Thiodiazotropha sp.]
MAYLGAGLIKQKPLHLTSINQVEAQYNHQPMTQPANIFSYKPFWAARFGVAPVLPMSREEMDNLGWDSCDEV